MNDALQALSTIEERIRAVERGTTNHRYFKVIFTDYSMPGMNGPELMGRIRFLYQDLVAEENAQPYLICCSSYTEERFEDEARFIGGADQFIHKPVN